MTDAALPPSSVISLPQGGGAIRGIGETFAPDPQTGTGNFTVPLAVPRGRNGLQPGLALRYSTGNGNGALGLGWQFTLPGISRTTAHGVPGYDEDLDTYLLSGSEDLVPMDTSVSARRYRPRTEGLFAGIVHHRDLPSGSDYWEVTGRDGLRSRYGSRRPLSPDPDWRDPATTTDPADPTRIFAWHLTRTWDPLGNAIEYEYDIDSGQTGGHRWRQPLLRRIRYVDHVDAAGQTRFLVTVTLTDEPRPDPFSAYTAGFEIRTTRRYVAVETAVQADPAAPERLQPVRRYEIGYAEDPWNGVSLLRSVAVVGFDHAGAAQRDMPPMTFGYHSLDPTSRRLQPVTGDGLEAAALSRGDHELVDLTGYGLPDLLQLGPTARYWRNLGGGRFDLPRSMRSAPAGLSLSDPHVQLLDTDGDGAADLVVTGLPGAGYFPLRFGPAWGAFRSYRSAPSFPLKDPNVRLLDLNADGVTDALRAGTGWQCFFADKREGWRETRPARWYGADGPPPVPLDDPRVHFADMTGDGPLDLVMLDGRSVEYWPNHGNAVWGDRVRMGAPPGMPDHDGSARLLFGDIDGDGAADLIRIADSVVTIWFNRCGNGWSDPVRIPGVPWAGWDVRLVDLLGTGTAGVLFSRPGRGAGRASMYFLDVSGGVQPRLLTEVDNRLGLVTRIGYRPSSAYARDHAADRRSRWRTSLPFVVPVVSRVETVDGISGGKLTTTFAYRHGHYDGPAREFRGFARVDRRDSESFLDYHGQGLLDSVPVTPVPSSAFAPPTLTRTWFHVGPVRSGDDAWSELDLSDEYWDGDPPLVDHGANLDRLLRGFTGPRATQDRRDALRALRGRVLRREVYGWDGSERAGRPYTVVEHGYDVREEPAAGSAGRPRVFFSFEVASRITQWERGHDPMTRFTFTGDYDAYGQPGGETAVAPPRRSARRARLTVAPIRAGAGRTVQPDPTRVLATHVRTRYARADDGVPIHDRIAAVCTYELRDPPEVDEARPDDVRAVLAAQLGVARSARDTFNRLRGGDVRLVRHELRHYDSPGYLGRPAGEVGPHGLLTRTECLVFREGTDGDDSLAEGYGVWRPAFLGGQAPLPPGAPAEFGSDLGYRHEPGNPGGTGHVAGWYADVLRQAFDVHLATAAQPAPARGLVLGSKDPMGNEIRFTPDRYWLRPAVVRDAAGLTTTVTYDYRAGLPAGVVDANGNGVRYSYHPLGFLAAVVVEGREGEGGTADKPTVRYRYDLGAYTERGEPVSVHTVTRVWHSSDVSPGAGDDVLESREYSDGLGRLLQKRVQADDLVFDGDNPVGLLVADAGGELRAVPGRAGGPALGDRAGDRVVVSGRQRYDNKGNVIESWEPYFDTGWAYRADAGASHRVGTHTYYDAQGRVVRVLNPDGSQRRVVFGIPNPWTDPDAADPTPWAVSHYDENDLAEISTGPSGAALADRAPAAHHWTPEVVVQDALCRPVCRIQSAGTGPVADRHAAQTSYDIRGNPVAIVDELGRTSVTNVYDRMDRMMRTDSIDAGRRVTILDAGGRVVATLDGRGCVALRTYDGLNRPAEVFARDRPDQRLTLRERLTYGDGGSAGQPAADRALARAHNRLGRLWRHCDEAGLISVDDYDFTGKVTRQSRRPVSDLAIAAAEPAGWVADWAAPDAMAALESRAYTTFTAFDALGRVVRIVAPTAVPGAPDRVLTPVYGRSGGLRAVAVDGVPYVRLLAHNARGQRLLLALGDGTAGGSGPGPVTRYDYDPRTLRLRRLRTERMAPGADGAWTAVAGPVLQDLTYTYDLVGNPVTIEERTPGCGVAGTADGRDVLRRRLGYDALYRLIAATGRTCADIGAPRPLTDRARCGSYPAAPDQSTAPNVTAGYRESYGYDPAGNLIELVHRTTTGVPGTWRRAFALAGQAPDDWADAAGNRLTAVHNGGRTPVPLAYDETGNVRLEAESREFRWDHAGRLVGFRVTAGAGASLVARYLYGADGTRVKKWVRRGASRESTLYLGNVAEHQRWSTVQGSGANSLLHVTDGASRIAIVHCGADRHPRDSGPPIRYELSDALGSAVLTLDAGGAWTNREEYFPYGETSFGGFSRKRYRFTGMERDAESGLAYHAARYYAPHAGRWFSCDPAGPGDGPNLYCYASGRPMTMVDRAGTNEKPPPAVHQANPFPTAGENPRNFLVENPGLARNWDRAVDQVLEETYRQGSLQENMQAYEQELRSLPDGPVDLPGTKGNLGRETYNAVRDQTWLNESVSPSFDYTPAQSGQLGQGRPPDPAVQLHHVESVAKRPEAAILKENIIVSGGNPEGKFTTGSPHHELHYGEGARRGAEWERKLSGRPGEMSSHFDVGDYAQFVLDFEQHKEEQLLAQNPLDLTKDQREYLEILGYELRINQSTSGSYGYVWAYPTGPLGNTRPNVGEYATAFLIGSLTMVGRWINGTTSPLRLLQ